MGTFDQFVQEHKEALKRIARRTRGDDAYDDVVSEAWSMAAMCRLKNASSTFSTLRPSNSCSATRIGIWSVAPN